ncbi:hypothetical protein PNK_2376 [Candidatus Protochlamydia naegleriophila]|uniref:Uncharacterized protein n=1 Tax=Candidatus Protochlamydia naegleriophila TaxID=389348 RepID=A0A0U5JGN0_9BACT|nr:hypothetical protein PNK_2376 [Candidatus Protochlamydia naegleriophila]
MRVHIRSLAYRVWNSFGSWPFRLKRYLKGQLQVGSELKLLGFQSIALVLLAMPKALDFKSDIWAVSCMLTGTVSFKNKELSQNEL